MHVIKDLGFEYAMSPYLDLKLQRKAQELGQLVVPGVFSFSEIQQAISFGFRVIKLFPASLLGIQYLQKIQVSLDSIPFVIAAGGMNVHDLNTWISKGSNAIALGRELIHDNKIDPLLEKWLQNN